MAEFSTIREKVTIMQLVDMIGVTNLKPGNAKVRGTETSVLRGTCPCCKEGGDRAFIVYPTTNSYYCWGQKHGGDVLELASRFYKMPVKDVGKKLESHFNISAPRIPPAEKGFDTEEFGNSLDPLAPELQPLGISPEILQLYGGGYCTRPSLKGKLALPVCDLSGNPQFFFGIEIETTAITFPKLKDFKVPYFFGDHKIECGTLHVVHHPLDVLRSIAGNMENVIALLTPVTPDVLAKLKDLMEAKQLDTVEFHT